MHLLKAYQNKRLEMFALCEYFLLPQWSSYFYGMSNYTLRSGQTINGKNLSFFTSNTVNICIQTMDYRINREFVELEKPSKGNFVALNHLTGNTEDVETEMVITDRHTTLIKGVVKNDFIYEGSVLSTYSTLAWKKRD